MWKPAVSTRGSTRCSVMTWGRGGWRGGREVQEGGDIYLHRADSHCSTAETNKTLERNYTPIKKRKKKRFTTTKILVD